MEVNHELLDVLEDIRDYFAMKDAEQERAKIDKPPKITETQKPIKGGTAPAGMKPAVGIAKQFVPADVEGTSLEEIEGSPTGSTETTALKAEDVIPEEEEEEIPATAEMDEEIVEEEEEVIPEEEEKTSDMELKSLLKDIKSLLQKNVSLENKVVELQKSMDVKIKKGIDSGMRKIGFTTTKPSIQKFGIDEPIKKSVDEASTPENIDKVVTDLSKESWATLGALRVKTGDLSPFPMYRPSGQ